MPLILAIEPDRRQASQLTAMVRGRLRAELVLAEGAEAAFHALGDRVPDLILTSALLSTKDEAMLADRLRVLDAAAAHVQTLTIPMLATPQPRMPTGRGVLSALLGDRPSPSAAPDGCDPAVFAEQCADYLARAAAEREHVDTVPHADVPAAADAATERPAEAVEEDVEIDLSSMLDESVVQQLSAAIETVAREVVPAAPASSKDSATSKSRRFPERKPIQDEWGFFDPAQCGFAALLAKLDEITHVASSLPAASHSAASPPVNR